MKRVIEDSERKADEDFWGKKKNLSGTYKDDKNAVQETDKKRKENTMVQHRR